MRVYKAVYKDPEGNKKQTDKWYLDFYDHLRRRHMLAGFTSKRPTEELGRNIEILISCRIANQSLPPETQRWIEGLPKSLLKSFTKWDLIDNKRIEGMRPLQEHILEWKQSIIATNKTEKHAEQQYYRVKKVFQLCKFTYWHEISASKLQLEVAKIKRTVKVRHKDHEKKGLREKVVGDAAQNTKIYFLKACKQFCKWMVMDNRASQDPLRCLKAELGPQKRKAALEPDELRRLLAHAEKAGNIQGLTGYQRSILYRVAAETGLRASELKALKVKDFDFKDKMVRLSGQFTKNRKDAELPLRDPTIDKLKEFFRGQNPDDKAFVMPCISNCARMMRTDLEDAKITIHEDRGTVGFHSLRHTFGSMLAASGVHPKTAQQLMRHSDINLTMSRYTHVFRGQETQAINSLPDLDTNEQVYSNAG